MRQIGRKGKLVLKDGSVYRGTLYGKRNAVGEVVFTTGMSGYQETLTDPSFCDQIVVMTYPLVGNYGINKDFNQGRRCFFQGYVISELCDHPSNWKNEKSLEDFLDEQDVPVLVGVDTRAITRKLRNYGVLQGVIVPDEMPQEEVDKLLALPEVHDQVAKVTTPEIYTMGEGKYHVAVMDYGIKQNILNYLASFGCRLTVFPAFTSAQEVLASQPDGIFLSNGPGDPKDLTSVIEEVKKFIGKRPIFGICLGHQCIGEVFGETNSYPNNVNNGKQSEVTHCLDGVFTGIDTPVKVARYHSLAVLRDDLPECLKVTAQTADGEIMAMRHKEYPVVGLQFHPESIYTEHGKRMIENFLSGVI